MPRVPACLPAYLCACCVCNTQVGRAFLQPYDLNSDASTFTAENTSGPVHQALQGLDPKAVQLYAYRPFSSAGGGGNSRYGGHSRAGTLLGEHLCCNCCC